MPKVKRFVLSRKRTKETASTRTAAQAAKIRIKMTKIRKGIAKIGIRIVKIRRKIARTAKIRKAKMKRTVKWIRRKIVKKKKVIATDRSVIGSA